MGKVWGIHKQKHHHVWWSQKKLPHESTKWFEGIVILCISLLGVRFKLRLFFIWIINNCTWLQPLFLMNNWNENKQTQCTYTMFNSSHYLVLHVDDILHCQKTSKILKRNRFYLWDACCFLQMYLIHNCAVILF